MLESAMFYYIAMVIIAFAGYFGGKLAKANKDGKIEGAELATIKTEITHIGKAVERIEKTTDRIADDSKESFKRAHDKIEKVDKKIDDTLLEHLKRYHPN